MPRRAAASPRSPSSTRRWSRGPTTGSRPPTTRPPTPWSSPSARRPAGWVAPRLADATIFTTLEPCAMCVGALLESDVEALVYALPNDVDGAAGTVIQLAQHAVAAAPHQGRERHPARRGGRPLRRRPDRLSGSSAGGFGILSRGEVSEWLMVPLSKSGVRKHRGFESRPLRHTVARTRRVGPAESRCALARRPDVVRPGEVA